MFDSVHESYQVGPSSIAVSVIERRAPTDESVRLLKEFEDKAREKVVESMRLTNNTIESVIHRHDDPINMQTHFCIFYKVNGQQREVRCFVEDYKSTISDKRDAIWKAVSEDMAAFMLGHATEKMKQALRGANE